MSRSERVLVVTSGGGHWAQMMRIRDALDGCEVVYASVRQGYANEVSGCRFFVVRDANRSQKLDLLRSARDVLGVIRQERPTVVVSTGAAPGLFGVMFGKLFGARTVWIDSIANAQELSLSGRLAARWADLYLTQWPELARDGGPEYSGAVL